jgi:hypothetical protein
LIEGGKIGFGDNREGVYTSDPVSGLSFYTRCYTMAINNMNNGIVRFDWSNPAATQCAFATPQFGMQGPDILKGVIVGKAGILIAFGGFNTTYHGAKFGPGRSRDQASLADIFVKLS